MTQAVYDYVKAYRARLDAPNILQGMRLQRVAQDFWQETSNEGTALERPIQRLGDGSPVGIQFVALWRANYGGRALDAGDDMQTKQEALDDMRREADAFLSMMTHVQNKPGVLSVVRMRGMSKEGLSTLPPELQREVEAFLSPGGRSEQSATMISKLMTQAGFPGVRSDVEVGRLVPGPRGPPPPPPGGAGPAAAGAGGPAGGKRRRKTRRGKGRKRYSRRR